MTLPISTLKNTEKLLIQNTLYVREIDEKFKHAIIDPSAFTSSAHLESLLESNANIQYYLSPILFELINEGKFEVIYDYFSWRIPKEYKIPEITYSFIKKAIKYEIDELTINPKLQQSVYNLKLPNDVISILLNQYNFLIDHSIMLARYRKTKNYLMRAGVPIIDSLNKLIEIKQDFIRRHKGVSWLVHYLIKSARVLQLDEFNPLVDMIFDLTDYVMWVFDP